MLIAKKEFDLLKQISHRSIIKVKDFFMDACNSYLVMELVKGKELFDRISQI